MCIAIFKPAGKIIPEAILARCMRNNPDGAGFAIVETDEKGGNELNIYKGYFDFSDFWKAWKPHQDKQALLHFRIATHGLTDGNNCHPFRVNENLALIHNGRLHSLPDDDKMSDTGVFVKKVVAPFAEMNPDFWLLPSFEWFFEGSITKSNKLVIMDVEGRYKIFNQSEGVNRDGIWYSNWSFNYEKAGNGWTNDEYWRHMRDCGDLVADGEIIEENNTSTPTVNEEIETDDVQEIDEVLEKYAKRHGSFVHQHLI